ncbi:sugar ABC transporter substrate-binding protein [Nocardia brasiliensis]|uniref:sugar ABC transporter substrate-binding protein n=1 Tax=Nocardia brasiliensis TaxID=37326 RepID=UPI003D8E15D2
MADALPTWLQVLIALVAVAAPVAAATIAYLGWHRQRRSGRCAQAAQVSAWWASKNDEWGVYVRNGSTVPIFQTYVTVLEPDERYESTKVRFMVVPPSQDGVFKSAAGAGLTATGDARRVRISFTDEAGLRWHRDQYGQLTELDSRLRIKTDYIRTQVFRSFEDAFLRTYGVRLGCETGPVGERQREFVANVQRKQLDAVICPHDWLGSLIETETVEPTTLSVDQLRCFPSWSLGALTISGKLYGLPTTVDTVALLRNTDLAPDPPPTLEALVAQGRTVMARHSRVDTVLAIRTGYLGDPFQLWPLLSSAGGWLFGTNADGTWNPDVVGLDAPESIAAFDKIRQWGAAGLLRAPLTREDAFRLFVTARTPFLISSSDALLAIQKSELRDKVAVTPVPPFTGGRPATPFTLVHGLMMVSRGMNRITAHDLFADYLTREHVLRKLSDHTANPIAADYPTSRLLTSFRELSEQGTAMPAFPIMNEVWRLLEAAELKLIAGGDARPIAERLATDVRRLAESPSMNEYRAVIG